MSVWTNITGSVTIPQKEKISLRKVIFDVFTDEFAVLNLNTAVENENCVHTFNIDICMDGDDFIRHSKEFFKQLKAVTYDINCELRFLK